VNYCRNMIQRGIEAAEQINILGDDGVPVSYHISFWKSELIDFILLQQDAFDTVDCSSSIERQNYMLKLIISIIQIEFILENFDKVSLFFKHIINLCKQLNYSEFKSHTFKKIEDELLFFIDTRKA